MARESFANRTTAILAMAGSAIGLGNIWRFPYMVGQYGGAAFILVYLLAAIFICVPIFISEAYIGKSTQLSTFGAFEKLAPNTGWKWVGLLTVITPIIILSFYSVVGGWSLAYLFKSLTLSFTDASATQEALGAYFRDSAVHLFHYGQGFPGAECGGCDSVLYGCAFCRTYFFGVNAGGGSGLFCGP